MKCFLLGGLPLIVQYLRYLYKSAEMVVQPQSMETETGFIDLTWFAQIPT